MGADNDGIAGLQGDQALEDRGGSGVRGGDDGGDDADGLSDLLGAESLVLFDHTTGLGVLVGVVDVLGSVVVLDDLILDHAHAGLFHGHPGQGDAGLVRGGSSGQEDLVHLLLGIGCENLLGLAGCSNGSQQAVNIFNQSAILLIHTVFLLIYGQFHSLLSD